MKIRFILIWITIIFLHYYFFIQDGALGVVWGPTQDGGYRNIYAFLPETPTDLRRQDLFDEVPLIIGLNSQDGAKIASMFQPPKVVSISFSPGFLPDKSVPGLEGGIFSEKFREFVLEVLTDWKVIDVYRERVAEAIEFQYTYWPAPENKTARGQEFINVNITRFHSVPNVI
jgi:hypothetical protein